MITVYPPTQVILGVILSFLFAPWIKKSKTKGRILYYLFTVSFFPVVSQTLVCLFSDRKIVESIFSAAIYLLVWTAMFLLLLFGQIHIREKLDADEAWPKFKAAFACVLFILAFSIIAVPVSMYLFELVW